MPVNMIVCCKQVPDPEAPPAVFQGGKQQNDLATRGETCDRSI